MHICLKNNPARFHPDPIWNGGALGFFWRVLPQQQQEEQDNNNKMGYDMGSVHDPKTVPLDGNKANSNTVS